MVSANTKLTKLLGIKTPILAAPMYYASTPAMVAAAAGAGGFGFIAAGFSPSKQLIEEIRAVRTQLNVPSEAPVPMGVAFIGWITDQTEGSDDPRLPAVLDERPQALWFAFGLDLGKYVAQVRAYDAKRSHKTLIFVIVNNVNEAVRAAKEWGVDVLVIQGNEAGGHGRGDAPPLFELVPAVLAAVPAGTVTVAAGGISSGAQIAKLLKLGTDGVAVGSRFLCTPESMYSDTNKEVIIKSSGASTMRNWAFDEVNRTAFWPEGYNGRAIVNDIVEDAKAGLPLDERLKRYDESTKKGDPNRLVIWAGDAIEAIHDSTTNTETILHELWNEALAA